MSSVADELDRMRALGLRIEASLCDLAGGVAEQGEWLEDLQQFDLLLQQMAALRDFLGALASAEGAQTPLDVTAAANQLLLHDLRSRLLGQSAVAPASDFLFFEENGP